MTAIAIAVLAILLAALIVKNTKEEIKDLGKKYVDFIKSLFTRETLSELIDDLKLVGYWVALPFLAVLFPVAAALMFAVRAFTK